jgi:protein-S-isoprenylcysteine O-methyltransferase Ste14
MALFGFFLIYFSVAVLLRGLVFYLQTGQNPLVPRDDGAVGYVDRALKFVFAGITAVVALHAFAPQQLERLAPFSALAHPFAEYAGWACLWMSLGWTVVAQAQMGLSWRIGIDPQARTELVCRGLFRLSRNPIFLAMRLMLPGLFLVLPNAATLALMVAGELLLQFQVRLEEAHLLQVHGDAYTEYATTVRRWL